MPEKIKDVGVPRGLSRWLYRLPIGLYKIGLGRLLGNRFLLLTHTGRKSGLRRKTVLEVVRFDKQKPAFVVAAGFGTLSDWYQNLRADPHAAVRSGRYEWRMKARFLAPDESAEEMADYGRRNPIAMKELPRLMGYRLDGSETDTRAFGAMLAMVMFELDEK